MRAVNTLLREAPDFDSFLHGDLTQGCSLILTA